MNCEGENISTDVFRYGAEPAHLFDIQSDWYTNCITVGACIDASFHIKVEGN